ncbi:biotin--[acetyl-CoA-carboxylase] ligase [uncultured Cohaesibacter sp.]|uniref:biotin--[acetyl-CoA-carboxylase] ligase n=1 Tax=uncultured Cohaesibacter sp. TaxID=1002546 RepID=UPI00293102FB|nr:biotin--[acetyl-CoA-carboxylase] ligase [uncultured Cohaesibacter sp.]
MKSLILAGNAVITDIWLMFHMSHVPARDPLDRAFSLITLPAPYRLQLFEQIDSTNKFALKTAIQGDGGFLWIKAEEQTDGKGRRGRRWVSERGNLFASLLLVDPAPVSLVGQLPLVTAVAVHAAVCEMLPAVLRKEIKIKWPNDLLWGNQKICGILLESAFLPSGKQAVAIGIGVNCQTHPGQTDHLAAADLSKSGSLIEPEMLFQRLASQMALQLDIWQRGDNFAAIRNLWLESASGLGQSIVARLPNEEVSGIFEKLDESGALVMRLAGGESRVIYAGDVFLPGMTD